MTKKDYILLADVLRIEADSYVDMQRELDVVISLSESLADRLEKDNPKFSRDHFLAVVRGEKALHSRPSRNGRQS